MAEARAIDLDTWPRREHFEHYLTRVECKFEITVDIDVTEMVAALRESSYKSYLAQIWAISSVVNRHAEFRMTLVGEKTPATWDIVHPRSVSSIPSVKHSRTYCLRFTPISRPSTRMPRMSWQNTATPRRFSRNQICLSTPSTY